MGVHVLADQVKIDEAELTDVQLSQTNLTVLRDPKPKAAGILPVDRSDNLNIYARYRMHAGPAPTDEERAALERDLSQWFVAFKVALFTDPAAVAYVLQRGEKAVKGQKGWLALVEVDHHDKLFTCIQESGIQFRRLCDLHERRREMGTKVASGIMGQVSEELLARLMGCPFRYRFLGQAADSILALKNDAKGFTVHSSSSNPDTAISDLVHKLPYRSGENLPTTQSRLSGLMAERQELNKRLLGQSLLLINDVARGFTSRLWNQSVADYWDLVQEGNLVALRAVELFDPGMGANFGTYLWTCVDGGLRSALKAWGTPMDATRKQRQLSMAYGRAKVALKKELGRDPGEDEIRAELGEDLYLEAIAARSAEQSDSLDDPGPNEDLNRWEGMPDRRLKNPERALICSELERTTQAILHERSPLHRQMASRHFGLSLAEDPALQELKSGADKSPAAVARELRRFLLHLGRDPAVQKRLRPYTYLLKGADSQL